MVILTELRIPITNEKTKVDTRTSHSGDEMCNTSKILNGFCKGFHLHSMDVIDDVTRSKLRHVAALLSQRQPDEPVVIIDPSVILAQHAKWLKLMPRVQPFYAIKANPDPKLISAIANIGGCFDCASLRTIDTVLQAGGKASNIIFANTAKIPSHIMGAASRGVDLMVFDSECELVKLKENHPKCKAVVRLHNQGKGSKWKLSSKFGASIDSLPSLLKKALDLEIEIVGVSFHVGCDCHDTKQYRLALEEAKQVFCIAAEMGINMTLVDIGGGFPGLASAKPSVEEFADEINKEAQRIFPDPNIKIIAEPGHYFARRTTGMLLQIHTKRVTKGNGREEGDSQSKQTKNFGLVHYHLNDGIFGNLHYLSYYGWGKYIFISKSKLNTDPLFKSMVWGPTCDSADVLGKDVMWPALQAGDYVFLDDVGAYQQCLTSNFNGYGLGITETRYM